MDDKVFSEARELCKPLKEHEPLVMAVWVFGSSVKEKKPNDIDIMVLIDDTSDLTKDKLVRIESTVARIKQAAKEKKVKLHFQPSQLLTKWWGMMQRGEPWVITSFENYKVIFDETGYVDLMSKLLKKGYIHNKDERAERLIERTDRYMLENRENLLATVEELHLAATEAAQVFLMFKSKMAFKTDKIAKELADSGINPSVYIEISDLAQKARKGTLSEFTGKNLDYYGMKVGKFINLMENVLLKKKENKK
jgi:predicted nucleotidyltransferase